MADDMPADRATIDAGPVGEWLDQMMRALRGVSDSDVACGTCVACCSSRQFVHVGPDEVDALAHIPEDVRVPAPGRGTGHVVLGYDASGRCPMLGQHGCTIYAHRPRTCRTYDCRVFVASGIVPDADQPSIAARVASWRFDEPTARDAAALDAVRSVAAVLSDPAAYPDGRVPSRAVQRAVIAVGLHELGLDGRATPAAVRVELARRSR
jgi:uncharacterized protein